MGRAGSGTQPIGPEALKGQLPVTPAGQTLLIAAMLQSGRLAAQRSEAVGSSVIITQPTVSPRHPTCAPVGSAGAPGAPAGTARQCIASS